MGQYFNCMFIYLVIIYLSIYHPSMTLVETNKSLLGNDTGYITSEKYIIHYLQILWISEPIMFLFLYSYRISHDAI